MSGRKKDVVWAHFNEKKSACGKFNKAVCKNCKKELMGLVARMKKHLETCTTEMDRNRNIEADDDDNDAVILGNYYVTYIVALV